MMQARKRASLVFLSWNGTVNALLPSVLEIRCVYLDVDESQLEAS